LGEIARDHHIQQTALPAVEHLGQARNGLRNTRVHMQQPAFAFGDQDTAIGQKLKRPRLVQP
jgi:hypothetical protein